MTTKCNINNNIKINYNSWYFYFHIDTEANNRQQQQYDMSGTLNSDTNEYAYADSRLKAFVEPPQAQING